MSGLFEKVGLVMEFYYNRFPIAFRAVATLIALHIFGTVMQAMAWLNPGVVLWGITLTICFASWLYIKVDKIPKRV